MNELAKKILEVLEIEPDVEFKTLYTATKITYIQIFNSKENKFMYYDESNNQWLSDVSMLNDLFCGECAIIHKPWKPKHNEKYYFVNEHGHIDYSNWNVIYIDLMYWHVGNCFKTKEEAEANKDRIMKLYESDTPLWMKVEDKE